MNKSKSDQKGDNPPNHRETYLKQKRKLKRSKENIKSLKRKSKIARNLKEKRIHKQIKKRELYQFEWHENTPDNLKETIIGIVKDLKQRRGHFVATEVKSILEKYQDRICKEKFDIGRIDGIQYKVRMKPGVKPIYRQPHNLAPEHEEEIFNTVQTLLKYKLIEKYEGPWASNVFVVRNADGSTRMVTL